MDKKTVEEMEVRFGEVMQTPPYPVDEILELIGAVPPGKAEEWTLAALKALTDAGDFAGTCRLVKARKEMLGAKLQGAGIRDALRKATEKFIARFQRMEDLAISQGKELSKMSLTEMDALWETIKHASE